MMPISLACGLITLLLKLTSALFLSSVSTRGVSGRLAWEDVSVPVSTGHTNDLYSHHKRGPARPVLAPSQRPPSFDDRKNCKIGYLDIWIKIFVCHK